MNDGERFDRALSALGSRQRRQLLVALLDHDPQSDGETVAVSERFDPVTDGGDPARPDIRFAHVHLPKLTDLGYITWDREAGRVGRGPNWSEIEPLLELLRSHDEDLPDGWL